MWPPIQKPIAPIRPLVTSDRWSSHAIAELASAIISSALRAPSNFIPASMPAAVVLVLDAGTGAVKVVRGKSDVALACDPLDHVADVSELTPKISMNTSTAGRGFAVRRGAPGSHPCFSPPCSGISHASR